MKLWKYSGVFLVITGVVHTLVAFFFGWSALMEIRAGIALLHKT